MGRRRMAEELQKHLMSITIHGDHFLLLKNKNPFISSSYVILSFCVIGVLFAASASRAAPRCRIIVSSCRIGPKRIPMKILAMISTRMSICSPPRPVTTNEIIREQPKVPPLQFLPPFLLSVYNRSLMATLFVTPSFYDIFYK